MYPFLHTRYRLIRLALALHDDIEMIFPVTRL